MERKIGFGFEAGLAQECCSLSTPNTDLPRTSLIYPLPPSIEPVLARSRALPPLLGVRCSLTTSEPDRAEACPDPQVGRLPVETGSSFAPFTCDLRAAYCSSPLTVVDCAQVLSSATPWKRATISREATLSCYSRAARRDDVLERRPQAL